MISETLRRYKICFLFVFVFYKKKARNATSFKPFLLRNGSSASRIFLVVSLRVGLGIVVRGHPQYDLQTHFNMRNPSEIDKGVIKEVTVEDN